MKTLLLLATLTLAGCGLTEDERTAYLHAREAAEKTCRDWSRSWDGVQQTACGDYNQLGYALAKNQRLEDIQ